MQMDIKFLNKTPVFVTANPNPSWGRVYGATYNDKENKWYFPAFPPFLKDILHDFDTLDIPFSYTEEAQQWISQQKSYEEVMEDVKRCTFPVESYEHQLEGLGLLLHNYRYGLEWEMGTGKTKVVVDTVKKLKLKTLILVPVIGLDTWVKETAKHTDDTIKTIVLGGVTQYRLKKFQETDIDMMIVSYGLARTQGIPSLYGKAVEVLEKKVGPVLPDALVKVLRRRNDSSDQARLAEDWTHGRKLKEIKEEVQDLIKRPQWIWDVDYDMIVADESHRIKHFESVQTKACMTLSTKAARRYIMSGTINQGDPRDLYPQLKFLAPYLIPGDYRAFCVRHLIRSKWNKKIVTGFQKLDVLNRQTTRVVDKRSLDSCVSLPPRQDLDVYFDLSPKQVKDYNYAVKESFLELKGKDPYELKNANKINKLFQMCSGFVYAPRDTEMCDTCEKVGDCVANGTQPGSSGCVLNLPQVREVIRYPKNPKAQAVQELLENITESGKKCIVWANFVSELDDIETVLKKKKWKYVRVDGTNSHQIKKYEKEFQEDKECLIYLGQISTGIVITLTAATYTIYYSRSWKLDDWLQSRNRNYRIGQKEKTVVYRLIARGTVEEQQLAVLDQRQDISRTLTQKINCVMCKRCSFCGEKKIEPWTDLCVLDRDVSRSITRARMLVTEE